LLEDGRRGEKKGKIRLARLDYADHREGAGERGSARPMGVNLFGALKKKRKERKKRERIKN